MHYWQGNWNYNFWSNLKPARLDADFRRIRELNFNTVIVSVPWGLYQLEAFPPRYSDESFQKLRNFLTKAAEHDLSVALRVATPEHLPAGIEGSNYEVPYLFVDDRELGAYCDLFRETARRARRRGQSVVPVLVLGAHVRLCAHGGGRARGAHVTTAYDAMEKARLVMGSDHVEWASLAVDKTVDVHLRLRGIMGVAIPQIEARGEPPKLPYSPGDASAALDEASDAFREVLLRIPQLSMLTAAVWRLANELRKTQRRVNALQHIFISV